MTPRLFFGSALVLASLGQLPLAAAQTDSAPAAAAPEPHAPERDAPSADRSVDTGHAVPTTGTFERQVAEAPPYSVGGIEARAGKDTWFRFFGFLQTRYVIGTYEDTPGHRTEGAGFSLARARLFFFGRLTDWLRVLVRVGASQQGEANFEQAFADFTWKEWSVRVGQFYLPVFQEQAWSPVNTLALESSAVGSVFDGGQTQGARLSYDGGASRAHLFVTDGLRTGFSEVGSSVAAQVAASVRLETTLGTGDYGRYNLSEGFRGERAGVMLGFGGHYQAGGALREGAVELGGINGDVTLLGNGYSLHLTASVINTQSSPDDSTHRVFQYGMVAQGGVFVLPRTELYGRYEALVAENTGNAGAGDEQSLFRGFSVGANQYLWPERGIRAIGDFTYYFDGTEGTPVAPNPNAGRFASYGSQWSARMQLNVLF